jgi:dihydroflavonol-4-reductase
MVTPQAVDIAKLGLRANCQKAFDELQLPRRPLRESLADALSWFAQHDYIWWPGMAKRIARVAPV